MQEIDVLSQILSAVISGLVGGIITGIAAFAAIRVELKYLRRDTDANTIRIEILERRKLSRRTANGT